MSQCDVTPPVPDIADKTATTDFGFPISLYPSKIVSIIREVNDCYGYPVDYVASAMLCALSVAIGNTHLARMIFILA